MRINVHSHVFQLRSVLSDDSLAMVQERLERELNDPKWLGKAASRLAGQVLAEINDFDEAELLTRLADEIKEAGGLQDLGEDLPGPLASLLDRGVDRATLSLARRGFAALLSALGRATGGNDLSRRNLRHVIDTLRLVARSEVADVAAAMFADMEPEDGAVLLALDLTRGDGADAQFKKQIEDTAALAWRYPGRAFPFYGLDPRRPDPLGRLQEAVEQLGYVGVKIYPSTGWRVDHPDMAAVYQYCDQQELPLLMHCNQGGFYADEADTANAEPNLWRPILTRFPDLKVCFAHFGGGGALAKPEIPANHWARQILVLMDEFPGVYADLSAHAAPMKEDDDRQRYFANLKALLATSPAGERLLFGTDFWLMRFRLTERRHWQFFEKNLEPAEFAQLAEANPARFLGLPAAGANTAAPGIVRLADEVTRQPSKLEGPVAAWLLDFIERRAGAEKRRELEAVGALFGPAPELTVKNFRAVLEHQIEEALRKEKKRELASGEIELLTASFNGGQVGLSGGGSVSFERFDDEDQKDPDGVLTASGGRRWLKTRVEGKLALRGRGEIQQVGLSLDASLSAVLADYRVFSAAQSLRDGWRQTLARPRFALSRGHVLQLAAGESLLFSRRGQLGVAASVSLADVVGSGLSELIRVAELPGPLGVFRVDYGVKATLGLTLRDDFQIVFTRRPGDPADSLFLSIKKLDARGVDFVLTASATLQWDNPQAVEAVLGQLVAQRLGTTPQQIAVLLGQAEAVLTAEQNGELERLGQKLGVLGLERVKEEYGRLWDRLRTTLADIARRKIEAGFRYEYHRLTTETTLFSAVVKDDTVEELHDQLVDGDFTALLDRSLEPGQKEVNIEAYLVEQRELEKIAWGFTLGSRIAGTDRKLREWVTQTANPHLPAAERQHKVSFQGRREYSGKWSFDKSETERSWLGELRAESREFSRGAEPTLHDLDFGFAFRFTWNAEKLSAAKLRDCLDAAALWGVLGEDSASLDRAFAALQAELEGKKAEIHLALTFDHQALMRFLPEAARPEQGTHRFAAALAAAMPYRDDAVRNNPARRRAGYQGVWLKVLEAGGEHQLPLEEARGFARAARTALEAQLDPANKKLAALEFDDDNGVWQTTLWTLGRQLRVNPTPAGPWRQALRGLGLVAEAEGGVMPARGFRVVEDLHQQIEPLWEQAHWVRAFGVYLLDWARDLGALGHVTRTCRAVVTEGGRERAVLFRET